MRRSLLSLAILLTATLPSHGQQQRFMRGPVTLVDQGSFFIGGVTKVSEHAAVPGAPPGQPVPAQTPQQITIGQMYVQFQVPARLSAPGWPVIMVHGSTHTGAEGGCSLAASGLTAADFDEIPYLAVKGDYTATSQACQESVDAINARRSAGQGTARADYLELDELGMLGVTHMMMLDANNLEIADLLLDWAGEHVPRARRR
jgi:hypothetical protein